jgi:LmbE family N-acetylglucosaminyl deacetylase
MSSRLLSLLILQALAVLVLSRRDALSAEPGLLPGEADAAKEQSGEKRLKIVVFGGHPDDPESGCGGLIARLTKEGHAVFVGYATCFRGDRKLSGEPEAQVRRREATAACKVLGATPHFFDYAHENLAADESTLAAVASWLKELHPDIVVTHWPLDTHENHHVTSSLVWQTYLREKSWTLYFFEVMTGRQTLHFRPDLYLDIADVRDQKKDACFAHQSQKPEGFWAVHEDMHRRRGEECGARFAEAYLLAEPLPGKPLLPVSFVSKKE